MAGRVSWFPGHMHKALKEMHRQMKAVDLVMEVRDARVPFSAANAEFDRLLANKRRVIVLNKSDLASQATQRSIEEEFKRRNQLAFHTCTNQLGSVRKLLETCRSWLRQESSTVSHLMMVLGLPNTGKSTLINTFRKLAPKQDVNHAMRQRGAGLATTGSTPGVTRQVMSFKVATAPSLYVLDTPGVMQPSLDSYESALRLGLTAAFQDKVVGEQEMVRYLLGQLVVHQGKLPEAGGKEKLLAAVRSTVLGRDPRELICEVGRGEQGARRLHPMASYDLLDSFFANVGLGDQQTDIQREVSMRKVLAAYRDGTLGKFTLDSLPSLQQ